MLAIADIPSAAEFKSGTRFESHDESGKNSVFAYHDGTCYVFRAKVLGGIRTGSEPTRKGLVRVLNSFRREWLKTLEVHRAPSPSGDTRWFPNKTFSTREAAQERADHINRHFRHYRATVREDVRSGMFTVLFQAKEWD